jgi:hypothetical protein
LAGEAAIAEAGLVVDVVVLAVGAAVVADAIAGQDGSVPAPLSRAREQAV